MEIQIQIDLLEKTDRYWHVSVSLSGPSILSQFFPVHTSFLLSGDFVCKSKEAT